MIGRGVAQRVEEATAASRVTPALGVNALGVGAHVQEFRPLLIVKFGGLHGPHQMSLATMGKFDFRSFTAVRAAYEQQWRNPQ
jgi:hypothetical protein